MGDLFDSESDPTVNPELRRHLQECAGCARDFACLERALAVPQPVLGMQASSDFKERTMSKLNAELQTLAAPRRWFPVTGFRLGFSLAGAAAILAIVVALPFIGSIGTPSGRGSTSGATALLAQSVQAMANLTSVHMIVRMRTLPNDNFELIGVKYDFVPIEMWKEFGDTPRWRVEKPGRVVVMDGKSSVLWMKPDKASRGGTRTGFVEWLLPLLDADKVMESELRAAQNKESKAVLAHDGVGRILLTVTRTAEGDLSNDWVRNKSIREADHTRIYSFDSATHRLNGLQVIVRDSGRDVSVLEISDIRYNNPLDAKLFALELPENVVWTVSPEEMPVTSQPLPATAKEAALAFFEGMADRNWDRVLTVYPYASLDDRIKSAYGGLQVISIGEPFQSGLYRGWFVPYEIRTPDGRIKKHNLAVRNDNRAGRFRLDGGF
jgi:hypothetical protein